MGLAILIALGLAPSGPPERPEVQRPRGLQPAPEQPAPEQPAPEQPTPGQPPVERPPVRQPAPEQPAEKPTEKPPPEGAPAEQPPPESTAPAGQPPVAAEPTETAVAPVVTPLEVGPEAAPEVAPENQTAVDADAVEAPVESVGAEDGEWIVVRETERRWKRDNQGRKRLVYSLMFSPVVYIPPPPIASFLVHVYGGIQFVPRFRFTEILRTRSFGYWGQVGGSVAPGGLLHRHYLALAGSGGPDRSVFYQVGGGVVHYLDDRSLVGGSVGATAGWRKALNGKRALLVGVPLFIDVLQNSDVRGSVGVTVGITNL